MKALKKYSVIGTVLFASFTLMFIGCGGNESNAESAKAQTEYNEQYDFTAQTLDGTEISLSDYQGNVVIVNMWDTWCPPCRMEIPDFIELNNQYGDKGFVMVGLAFGREGLPAVKKFVDENGMNYINATVNQDVVNRLGNPRGIPTTFVFDQSGNIAQKYTGYREKSVFENDIKTLLNL